METTALANQGDSADSANSSISVTTDGPISPPVVQTAPITFSQRMSWLGNKIFNIVESIGEGVVSVLGRKLFD